MDFLVFLYARSYSRETVLQWDTLTIARDWKCLCLCSLKWLLSFVTLIWRGFGQTIDFFSALLSHELCAGHSSSVKSHNWEPYWPGETHRAGTYFRTVKETLNTSRLTLICRLPSCFSVIQSGKEVIIPPYHLRSTRFRDRSANPKMTRRAQKEHKSNTRC